MTRQPSESTGRPPDTVARHRAAGPGHRHTYELVGPPDQWRWPGPGPVGPSRAPACQCSPPGDGPEPGLRVWQGRDSDTLSCGRPGPLARCLGAGRCLESWPARWPGAGLTGTRLAPDPGRPGGPRAGTVPGPTAPVGVVGPAGAGCEAEVKVRSKPPAYGGIRRFKPPEVKDRPTPHAYDRPRLAWNSYGAAGILRLLASPPTSVFYFPQWPPTFRNGHGMILSNSVKVRLNHIRLNVS
jgi:hypothetical protein